MKKTCNSTNRPSRRKFARSVATCLIAAPLAASLVRAQKPGATKESPAPPQPSPSPGPPKPTPLGTSYAEVARIRFGENLSPEQLEELKKGAEGNVRLADRLRAFKLQNGDEPDFIFSA